MARRKYITRIVTRKYGYAVIRHGHVQFRAKDIATIETFLAGFDPELAARRKSAPRINALIEQLIKEANEEERGVA